MNEVSTVGQSVEWSQDASRQEHSDHLGSSKKHWNEETHQSCNVERLVEDQVNIAECSQQGWIFSSIDLVHGQPLKRFDGKNCDGCNHIRYPS